MESGNPLNYVPFLNSTFYQPQYDLVLNQTGCSDKADTLNCLRSLSYPQLNSVFNQSIFNSSLGTLEPVIDGDFIQKYGSAQLAHGDFVHVPIISGANSDEGTTFGPPGLEYRRTCAYAGDEVFIAARRLTCETWANASVPAYSFRFNARPAGASPYVGVTHFAEIGFVFNNIEGLGYAINPFEAKPQSYTALSKLMSCSWASFVHDLDPNSFRNTSALGKQIAGNVPEWLKYGGGAAALNMVWDANFTSHTEPDTFRSAGIDLIKKNSLLYGR